MAFPGKTVASTFKDILQIDNSNAGISTSLKVVKDGTGNQSSLYISDDQIKIQPENDDTTALLEVKDKDGDQMLLVDSSNDAIKSFGHHLNTKYAYFGMAYDGTASWAANTHYPVIYNGHYIVHGAADVDFGGGTDPDDTFTTADTDTQYASQIVPMLWRVPDNITIDSVTHVEGADNATGDTTRMHLKSFTFTSGATACLTAGALLAHNSDITNAGNEQPYLSTWTVDSADVDANKVILCFFRSDSNNSDFSLNVTVKYHLR